MPNIKLFNKISKVGLDVFDADKYTVSDSVEAPEGILVRSAALHEVEFNKELLAIARAGAGVNNIPIDRCSEQGIVVFNTPGANANGVKELAMAALLLASRNIVGGINWALGLKG
ncbi:MAG: 3-phosphoglycerate dehydrogenase, partial [Clostridia bacterium]|nr:3-phosphoglycerate dehydrogenase [Clostridia bacterium]